MDEADAEKAKFGMAGDGGGIVERTGAGALLKK